MTALVEDPGAAADRPTREPLEAARLLAGYNPAIYKAAPMLTGGVLEPDPRMGIGRCYAWQLPVYPRLLGRHL